MPGLTEQRADRRTQNTIQNLVLACGVGDIQRVQEIVASKEVDINDSYDYLGKTSLMWAMNHNKVEIVTYLLKLPELQLDKRDRIGRTALHWAALYGCVPVIRLFCQDRRCTPSIVNMKDKDGETALMKAVQFCSYYVLKELEKVEGADFRTKDRYGSTLIEIARRNNHAEIVEFLKQRNIKVESLKVITAYSLAKYLKNKGDVEKIDIPCTLKPLVEGFIDDFKSDDNDEEENEVEEIEVEEDTKERLKRITKSFNPYTSHTKLRKSLFVGTPTSYYRIARETVQRFSQ